MIGTNGVQYKEHIDTSIQEKRGFILPLDKTDIVINILKEIKDAVSFSGQSERTVYYNSSGTSTVAVSSVPSVGSTLYTKEYIYNSIGRKAEKVYVLNDGPGILYVRASYKEGELFTNEITIRDGEYIILRNVYELRHRSDTVGQSYRVTEYETLAQTVISSASDVEISSATDVEISKPEELEIMNTDKDLHFTEEIAMNAQEEENITGLAYNKYLIRGVNIQSIQQLKFRLIFWGSDTFDNTDLDTDVYIDDVELNMAGTSAFRIDNANQYRLNVGSLDILYEDYDATKELHISLQNLSAVAKNAGATGTVQIDIKMSPRL